MNRLSFDQCHIWHPYNKLPSASPQLEVISAQGSLIQLADGRTLIDGMSSWWSAIHGYNHPQITQAAIEQIQHLSHIMFGGFTHEPAIELAQKLAQIAPPGLVNIFFADSGSISVEVALKVALQYWKSRHQPQKNRFLALENAYHGDTFGAMSVCDPISGMHHLFADNLMNNLFAPAPGLVSNDNQDIKQLEAIFNDHHHQLAAFIVEPMVQGAGGMHFYRAAYLKRARELCDEYDVLLIADEIATGFGRTGKLFACEWAEITPDIMCVGKGLSGGYMTLAAMLCRQKISDTISQANPGLLMHGPTFMGNPLACRIACASIDVLLQSDWQHNINRISAALKTGLETLSHLNGVSDVRVLGAIGVVELDNNEQGQAIQQAALQQGIWIRPFGKLIYTMPAYNIPAKQLDQLIEGMVQAITEVLTTRPGGGLIDENLASQFV